MGERVLDYPSDLAESLTPCAQRIGLERGDGIGLLDELLGRAGTPNRDALVAEARGR